MNSMSYGLRPDRTRCMEIQKCGIPRWIVDYENETGIALYQKLGLGFVPDEVAGVEPPEKP